MGVSLDSSIGIENICLERRSRALLLVNKYVRVLILKFLS
jgi:hypothetical protein